MSSSNLSLNAIVSEIIRMSGSAKMRPVIEKEVLHYDIFQALHEANLLKGLVFQGGTSLRLCRGSSRFSEDLDFAGGVNFNASNLADIKNVLESYLGNRYGLVVYVKEPMGVSFLGNNTSAVLVDKWQIAIETSPESSSLPRQKIKIEVANVPAYTSELVPLKMNYPQLQGYTNPVLVRTETMTEILADKVLAFPASGMGARIRHRDIWDIAWLIQHSADLVKLDTDLVKQKVLDYGTSNYAGLLKAAIGELPRVIHSTEFTTQMERFIDAQTMGRTLLDAEFKEEFKDYFVQSVGGVLKEMQRSLTPQQGAASTNNNSRFKI